MAGPLTKHRTKHKQAQRQKEPDSLRKKRESMMD